MFKGKADVNKVDAKGLSGIINTFLIKFLALHKAVRAGSLDIVKVLVESGSADVNLAAGKEVENCTPLQEAAFHGKKEILEYLLEHDTVVDQQNTQGNRM